MSDSYHFQIEPEPAKEALFREGSVYLDGLGRANYVESATGDGRFLWVRQWTDSGSWDTSKFRHCADGRFECVANEDSLHHLLPGEVALRGDGKWIPRKQMLQFPSGATLTTCDGKITGRTEPKPAECIEDLLAYAHALATAVPAEPQRAPLPNSDAWRYTGKERDAFPEFVVTRETVIDFALPLNKPMPKGGTLHAHPGVGSALLRG